MRGQELFEKITNIDDKFITQTVTGKKSKRPVYMKWISVAACFAVIISVIIVHKSNIVVTDPNLPLLTLNTEVSGSMGFEGSLAFSIDDLTNANPWNEDMNITHLPVMKNNLAYNERQQIEEPDYVLMEKLLKDTAKNLGMDVENLSITNDIPDEETKKIITDKFDGDVPKGYFDISRLFIEDEFYKIEVMTNYTITVEYKNPIELPNKYFFAHNSSYDEMYEVAEYLQEEYSGFIDMENPQINISGGDFNVYANQLYDLYFFESSNEDAQMILNYHFNNVKFYCDVNGKLYLARKFYTDLSDVMGQYPIITADEALTLLENGNYITTVPQDFDGAKYVKKVELVYRTSGREEIFMPYYRFYVKLPKFKHEDTGLNTYGAYYVLAIESKYIENMPVWDGGFNQ